MTGLKKLWLLVLVVALLGVACGEEEEDSGGQEISLDLEASDFAFNPTTLLVEPGSEVTVDFSNIGGVAHSLTIPDLDFEIEAEGGDSVESSFTAPDEPGSLDFFCKFHPDDMSGVVSVGGSDQPIEEDVDDEDDDDADVDVDVDDEETDDASGDATRDY